jgi:hypothetical protein
MPLSVPKLLSGFGSNFVLGGGVHIEYYLDNSLSNRVDLLLLHLLLEAGTDLASFLKTGT